MHCLDCRTQAATHTAIGICHDCGAAVEEHACMAVIEDRRGPMLSTPYQPPVRTVRCAMCATARAA